MARGGRINTNRWIIWWLDQWSAEVCAKTGFADGLPDYIRNAFYDRFGRAGRGRLWLSLPSVSPDRMTNTDQMEFWGGGDWGGIVVPHSDRHKLAFAPGFLTDLNGHFVASLTNSPTRDYPERKRRSAE